MPEFREYGPPEEETEGSEDGGQVEEVLETLRGELGFVYDNPDNGATLDRILKLVEDHYEQS